MCNTTTDNNLEEFDPAYIPSGSSLPNVEVTVSSSYSSIWNTNPQEIVDFKLIDNQIEVTFRVKSNKTLACFPSRPAPDKVWKEVYGIVDEQIQLIKTINGTHIPRYTVDEQFKFEE